MQFFDEFYYTEDEFPDFGTIQVDETQHTKHGKRTYTLDSTDVAKLESLITYCASGSVALVRDTGDVYQFNSKTTPKWAVIGG